MRIKTFLLNQAIIKGLLSSNEHSLKLLHLLLSKHINEGLNLNIFVTKKEIFNCIHSDISFVELTDLLKNMPINLGYSNRNKLELDLIPLFSGVYLNDIGIKADINIECFSVLGTVFNELDVLDLKEITMLSNLYAGLTYQIANNYYKQGFFTLKTNELKEYYDISHNETYNKITMIEKNIIKPSIDEVNNKTKFNISFEKLKYNNKVSGFKFLMD